MVKEIKLIQIYFQEKGFFKVLQRTFSFDTSGEHSFVGSSDKKKPESGAHKDAVRVAAQAERKNELEEETSQSSEKYCQKDEGKEVATGLQLYEKLRQQGFRCALSGQKLIIDEDGNTNAEIDHIEPVSISDDDSIENLQILESRINRMKGTLTQSEFIRLCRLVSQWSG